jgi:hypothetical protein
MKSSVFWDITRCSLSKVNGLHGTISQKMELSITTAERTSDPVSRNTFQTECALHCMSYTNLLYEESVPEAVGVRSEADVKQGRYEQT